MINVAGICSENYVLWSVFTVAFKFRLRGEIPGKFQATKYVLRKCLAAKKIARQRQQRNAKLFHFMEGEFRNSCTLYLWP